MPIKLKRVYEKPEVSDGKRVLVERLWPRGLSKEKAQVDLWIKDAAPSTELRKWFNHEASKWEQFKSRYFKELDSKTEVLEPIIQMLGKDRISFVYASKEETHNNSAALREYLGMIHKD